MKNSPALFHLDVFLIVSDFRHKVRRRAHRRDHLHRTLREVQQTLHRSASTNHRLSSSHLQHPLLIVHIYYLLKFHCSIGTRTASAHTNIHSYNISSCRSTADSTMFFSYMQCRAHVLCIHATHASEQRRPVCSERKNLYTCVYKRTGDSRSY